MTLIELLVVVVIITTLVAAAIPLIAPSNDDRRLRESARELNTFIAGAQTRAIALRRPFGVAIKRLSQDTKKTTVDDATNDNGMSVEAFYVEQLPPYAGFDANSRACVAFNRNIPGSVLIRFVTRGVIDNDRLPKGWDTDPLPDGVLRPGDVIDINGTQFELVGSANADVQVDNTTGYFISNKSKISILIGRPVNDSGQLINPKYDDNGFELPRNPTQSPYWTGPTPYKVFRRPTPTSDEPFQMPEGTAIDLRASGVGQTDYFYVQGLNDNAQGIMLMFAPEGRLSRVTFSTDPNVKGDMVGELFDQTVVDSVYLLVGRRDKIPPAASSDPTLQTSAVSAAVTDDQKRRLREPINWLSDSSRWIVIAPQTGRITTIENGFVDLAPFIQKYTNGKPPVPPSSEALRTVQILEAREYTREMGLLRGR